jgi:hypothetical protein
MGFRLKILLFGYGSIGKRHVANIQSLWPQVQIEIYDPLLGLDTNYIRWTDEHSENADGAIIASPTQVHLEQATLLMAHGIPFYIEKPVCTVQQIDEFGKLLAREHSGQCCVGHQYRFAIDWPREVRSLNFIAYDNLVGRYSDVGEALAAHPIDTSLWLLGKPLNINFNECSGMAMRGMITHERGTSYHCYAMNMESRTSIVGMFYSDRWRHAVYDLPADNSMYLAAMDAWLKTVWGELRDQRLCTLEQGLDVVKVLAKVKEIK